MDKNIIVFGGGYVGLSLSVLLAQNNYVSLVEIDKEKINKVNARVSPIDDSLLQEYLLNNDIKLKAIINFKNTLRTADTVILALPTNYDETSKEFDTSSLEDVIGKINESSYYKPIVIKSTVPIGFTLRMQNKFPKLNLLFSPEFLREGKAVEDNLFPSRIIVGGSKNRNEVAKLLNSFTKKDSQTIMMSSSEAEAVKLFANTYLATRISFFNELDSFCYSNNLNTKDVIDGVSLDKRIGNFYNNPSFGYGGYCLPKDTKQLLSNFDEVPKSIIKASIESNILRKEFIINSILKMQPKTVGIYRLVMKKGSDNFRESAVFYIMNKLYQENIEVIIYEPLIEKGFDSFSLINQLDKFKSSSDVIIANRMDKELNDIGNKVFTRDVYGKD